MKTYMVIIYRNKKEVVRAAGPNLDKLVDWAKDCLNEESGLTFETFVEE